MRAAALRILGAVAAALTLVGFGVTDSRADETQPTSPAPVAVLVPIIADAGDGQFLSADDIAAETAPDGDWSLLVSAAQRYNLTVALDSRIIASIAALGDSAPESARTWNEAVTALDPIVLPWGNADVWALTNSIHHQFTAEQFGILAGIDPSSLVPWPSGNVVLPDSLGVTESRGFTQFLGFDDQFVGGINANASRTLGEAVAPGSKAAIADAVAAIRSEAVVGSSIALPAEPSQLDATRASAVLAALFGNGQSSFTVSPLRVTVGGVTRSIHHVVEQPGLLSSVLEQFTRDEERAAAISDEPAAFMANRVRELAVITRDLTSADFEPAAERFIANNHWVGEVVSISIASEYTVLSNSADVPISISNSSNATVSVSVNVRSTSGIVQVDVPSQAITIEPRSNVRITVPMTVVANGRTSLVATLVDPDGNAIGSPVSFPIVVQAQWEIVTVVVFFGSVVVIMTIGIIRTIRRRRALA